jgi:preprotein translocase subunit SecA
MTTKSKSNDDTETPSGEQNQNAQLIKRTLEKLTKKQKNDYLELRKQLYNFDDTYGI